MSRDETQIIKGLAILMMLWLHLFANIDAANSCYNFLYVSDVPLSNFLSRACNPVDLYLLLGGYGLYCVYLKGKDNRRFTRIFKLYIHYWIILLITIPIIYLFSTQGIEIGSLTSIVKNLTAFRVSWDAPCWFLFPYSIISLSYPLLFHCLEKFKIFKILLCVLLLSLIQGNLYSNCSSFIRSHSIIYVINNTIGYLLPFFIGAAMKKSRLIERLRNKYKITCKSSILFLVLFVSLIILKCVIRTRWYNIYEFAFVLLFLFMYLPRFIDKFLWYMGKHSMNIWMIHFMVYFYFEEFVYSFKFPILIWLCLTGVSLIISYIVDFIAKLIEKPLFASK